MPSATGIPESGLEAQLLDLFLYLGSAWILYTLLFLSVVSVAITIERIVYFMQRRVDLEAMQKGLNDHLSSGNVDAARAMLSTSQSSVSVIILQGIDALERGAAAVEEILAGATQSERLKMERGLAFLGTLGNNAPFIGLFGTVLGIIRSFNDLAEKTMEGTSAVMAGIAEALIATAVGLLVALPAVALFNAFQRAVRKQLATSEAMGHVLLAHAKERKE